MRGGGGHGGREAGTKSPRSRKPLPSAVSLQRPLLTKLNIVLIAKGQQALKGEFGAEH